MVWHEFTNVIGTLNIKVHEDFAKHLAYLQEDPDLRFVKTLMYTYQDNQPLLQTLNELSTSIHPEINPLESCAQCLFSSRPDMSRELVKSPTKQITTRHIGTT